MSDMPEILPGMRRRPWWLIADGPGRAALFLVFPGFLLLVNAPRFVDGHLRWVALLYLACMLAVMGSAVATLIAFRRHPDWIDEDWAPGPAGLWWARYGRRMLIGMLAVGVLLTVTGIVVIAGGAGTLGATLMACGLFVAVAGGLRLSIFDAFGPAGLRDTQPPERSPLS